MYGEIDILIVPSKWKESFGLVVLEALSYNVEVYVSENVGAKDLLYRNKIFSNIMELRFSNNTEPMYFKIKSMREHCLELISLYE